MWRAAGCKWERGFIKARFPSKYELKVSVLLVSLARFSFHSNLTYN